jgi:hypothetical protein
MHISYGKAIILWSMETFHIVFGFPNLDSALSHFVYFLSPCTSRTFPATKRQFQRTHSSSRPKPPNECGDVQGVSVIIVFLILRERISMLLSATRVTARRPIVFTPVCRDFVFTPDEKLGK